jgi:hypothetical protein
VTVVLALLVNRSALRDGPPTPSHSASPTAQAELPPVTVPAPPRTAAADRYCPDFLAALPITLDGLRSRPAHSDSPYVGAWGDPPVVFRCGVGKPAGFDATSALTEVNGVQWFYRQDGDRTVFTAVDRPVYVELTVPTRYTGAPLTEVTAAVGKTLPPRPLDVH